MLAPTHLGSVWGAVVMVHFQVLLTPRCDAQVGRHIRRPDIFSPIKYYQTIIQRCSIRNIKITKDEK